MRCGSPSATPKPGEHVVHVAPVTGYYTAILAHPVGRSAGTVTAIEPDPGLPACARSNLASLPYVHVLAGDGAAVPLDPADVVYINAGATRPADAWLDALAKDGRLILPITVDRFPQACAGVYPRKRLAAT